MLQKKLSHCNGSLYNYFSTPRYEIFLVILNISKHLDLDNITKYKFSIKNYLFRLCIKIYFLKLNY